tara:strand:+ start:644 stop:1624 length:981 start_codon:yes stop_codon:yes gene_type:complete
MNKKKILVTGCAGFIGSYLVGKLIETNKYIVYGIDNLNNYYDYKLKKERLNKLLKKKSFFFYKFDISNSKKIIKNFKKNKYDFVFHLAAQAGVRFSIKKPDTYLSSNIIGFYNILEASKITNVKLIYFASSSSVYGDKKKFPVSEKFNSDTPKSFYAATKKCNEIMAYSYSHLYNMKIIGLRFFTVYGPLGRPDMTPFSFLNKYYEGKYINIYNKGNHQRDFTYIDDVINFLLKLFEKNKKNVKSNFEIFNIGRGKPQRLLKYIKIIEKIAKIKFKKKFIGPQAGDVKKTYSNLKKIFKITNYKPKIDLEDGLKNFIGWYKKYYKI